MRLEFEIHLAADYHVGAGYGLDFVDSALMRDSDGVPVLRGTTCEGLLRDGLWRLLQTKPLQPFRRCQKSGLATPDYCLHELCPVGTVFGSPALRKHWHISTARPQGVPYHLVQGNTWKKGETGAQAIMRNRVDPRQRRAEAHKLFSEEEGDQRLVFTFIVEGPECSEQACTEAAWLVAAARMVRRLGSSRRRGRGACTIKLVKVDGWYKPEKEWQDVLLDHFCNVCIKHESVEIAATSHTWNKTNSVDCGCKHLRVTLLNSFCKTVAIDGFNHHLGLPRQRDLALRAGSAVGFRLAQRLSSEQQTSLLSKLATLEKEGIGLRRSEGFGQIAFNHPLYQGNGVDLPFTLRKLPDDLRLACGLTASAQLIYKESTFIETWATELKDDEKFQAELFKHAVWDGVARWLWQVAGEPLANIEQGLDSFGDASLVTQVKRQIKVPFDEWQSSMAHLKAYIQKLDGKSDGLRRTAIQMLADRLAACCETDQKRS